MKRRKQSSQEKTPKDAKPLRWGVVVVRRSYAIVRVDGISESDAKRAAQKEVSEVNQGKIGRFKWDDGEDDFWELADEPLACFGKL